MTLPEGISINSDSHEGQLDSQILTWNVTQAVNSVDETIVAELGTDAIVMSKELTFELSHTVAEETLSESIGTVDLTGISVAKINGEDLVTVNVNEKTSIALAATGSSVPEADDSISYEWTQTSGPDVVISDTSANEVTISIPDVTVDTEVVLELTVSNGESMDTAAATINVKAEVAPTPEPKPENKSSGGSLGFATLVLGLIAIRRKVNH